MKIFKAGLRLFEVSPEYGLTFFCLFLSVFSVAHKLMNQVAKFAPQPLLDVYWRDACNLSLQVSLKWDNLPSYFYLSKPLCMQLRKRLY